MEKEVLKILHERELHKFLVSFLANNLNIYTKTIFHEASTKSIKGRNEWLHPDLVGFSLPVESWDEKVLELCGNFSLNRATIYSFEMKKSITLESLREQFFQAVSNSSWANEGYLVAVDIDTSNDLLMQEMTRLSGAFGIGIIKLNLLDFEHSEILFHSKRRSNLNGETMNRLIAINNDFQVFVQTVLNSIKINSPVKHQLDDVLSKEELKASLESIHNIETDVLEITNDYDSEYGIAYPLSTDFTGKKPAAIQIENEIIEVESWRLLYIKVCEYLINKDSELFLIFKDKIKKSRKSFSTNKTDLNAPCFLPSINFYVETNLSSKDIIRFIKQMIEHYEINENKVKIYV